MMMTLKDIAIKTGVSTATVSHVINNTGRVGKLTRKKISEAIEELNYQPNKVAKSLKTRKTNTIGVIAEDVTVFNTPEIIDGINQFAEDNNYNILLVNLRIYKKIKYDVFNKANFSKLHSLIKPVIFDLLQNQVEGIVYIGSHQRNVTDIIPVHSIPSVYTYCYTVNDHDRSINYNDEEASYHITKYLINCGHQKIAVISGLEDSIPSKKRLKGYYRALAEHEIEINKSIIKTGDWELESGLKWSKELLKNPNKPTAIVALNDLMAAGAIKGSHELGLNVPEDISIVGFDNREFCTYLNPKITTMSIPLHEMGGKSMEVLNSLINNNENTTTRDINLKCKLIIRDSVMNI